MDGASEKPQNSSGDKQPKTGKGKRFIPFRWGLADKYLFFSTARMFLLCIAALVLLVFSTGFIFELTDIWLARRAPLSTVFKIFIFSIPEITVRTLPAAMLFSVVLVFGVLSRNKELEAMRTSGITLVRIARPVALLGFVVSLCTFLTAEFVVPPSARMGKKLRARYEPELAASRALVMKDLEGNFLFAGSNNPDLQIINYVISLKVRNGKPVEYFSAVGGLWTGDYWSLSEALHGEVSAIEELGLETREPRVLIPVGATQREVLLRNMEPGQMTISELRQLIRIRNRGGLRISTLITELNFRFSVPVSCLVFVLLGLPLAVRFGNQERYVNIVICFMIISFFWGLMAVSKSLGAKGIAEPYLGVFSPILLAWSQNVVFGLSGLLLIHWTQR